MFLLASVSVIGCVWALVRYYTHPPVPMTAPIQMEAGVQNPDEHPGETPAPPLVPAN